MWVIVDIMVPCSNPTCFSSPFPGTLLGGSGGLSKWVISRLISTLLGLLIGVMIS